MCEQIERIAKAMREVDGPRVPVWDDMTVAVQDQYRTMAREAVKIIRSEDQANGVQISRRS